MVTPLDRLNDTQCWNGAKAAAAAAFFIGCTPIAGPVGLVSLTGLLWCGVAGALVAQRSDPHPRR